MSCLIEGFFQPANGRPFADNSADTATTSPRKSKTYLSVYDSCAGLGPISSGIFMECELRLFPANHTIDGKVIHAHGRFSVITAADKGDPHLEIEVHRFVIMNMMDPSSEDTPDDLRTSVTLSGRVVPVADTINSTDKFFTLEVSEYIRDRTQTFNIRFVAPPLTSKCVLMSFHRCRLNRTSSKRWENTTGPAHGSTVLVSGYLMGENPASLQVEVETMHFITALRGGEGVRSPQMSGKTKFGIPKGFVCC